jgi:hypothetical protein
MITQCLSSGGGRLLARVRMLHVFGSMCPALQRCCMRRRSCVHFTRSNRFAATRRGSQHPLYGIGPAFAGLSHPWLRYFTAGTATAPVEPTVPSDRNQPCLR